MGGERLEDRYVYTCHDTRDNLCEKASSVFVTIFEALLCDMCLCVCIYMCVFMLKAAEFSTLVHHAVSS